MYFELKPISISFPDFSIITSSFTFPSSERDVIVRSSLFIVIFIRLFFPSLARSEALSILSKSTFLSATTVQDPSLGSISLYLINSPSRSLTTAFVSLNMNEAFLLPISISISSSSSESLIIFLISFISLPFITTFFSLSFDIFSLTTDILNPSKATILRLSLSISVRTPVMIPFDSSMLAAKDVFLIISPKSFLSSETLYISSSVSLIFGNSSGDIPTMLNSENDVFTVTLLSSSEVI